MSFANFFHSVLSTISFVRPKKLIILFMLIPALSHADEWNIKQLMTALAQVQTRHALFIERKSIALLTVPVESSGELIYTAPNHLVKRTLKPKRESMVLDEDTLNIELSTQQNLPIGGKQTSKKNYQLQLQDYPEIAVFIDSIRGTLAGDLPALQKNYQLSLIGNIDDWTLSLNPTNEKMQALVKNIDISGEHNAIHRIEINQTDGDSSLMLIEQKLTP
ncbi:MAG TPA: outer membrane lipoprotein carrier protein LolA [Methylophaga sp.]|nr:outer membrane lipoprotein carrier protein LolA [Methylophaga sp.]HEC59119.1 outer membrane lipoprotein carrier protein LolA [Methylophaga sp.]